LKEDRPKPQQEAKQTLADEVPGNFVGRNPRFSLDLVGLFVSLVGCTLEDEHETYKSPI